MLHPLAMNHPAATLTAASGKMPPRVFMCAAHWYMLPRVLRKNVWRAYFEGQEIRKDLSPEYLEAAQAAIN